MNAISQVDVVPKMVAYITIHILKDPVSDGPSHLKNINAPKAEVHELSPPTCKTANTPDSQPRISPTLLRLPKALEEIPPHPRRREGKTKNGARKEEEEECNAATADSAKAAVWGWKRTGKETERTSIT
ncbi:hypothetical protein NL676_012713 [Syzygium grande]|nr:hypothetical protein NL676_012713 [Syzygium grande]